MSRHTLRFLFVLILLLVSGCGPTKVVGKSENLVPSASVVSKKSQIVPIYFLINGTKRFRYHLQHTNYACGGGGYDFQFADAAINAAAATIDSNFHRADTPENAVLVDLVITDMKAEVNCRKTFFKIYCGGSTSISASLLLNAPDGRLTNESITAQSDETPESDGLACEVAPEEAEKNFNSAFKNLMTKMVSDTLKFVTDSTVASAY